MATATLELPAPGIRTVPAAGELLGLAPRALGAFPVVTPTRPAWLPDLGELIMGDYDEDDEDDDFFDDDAGDGEADDAEEDDDFLDDEEEDDLDEDAGSDDDDDDL